MKEKLLGKTPEELKEAAVRLGLPAFAGKQIAQWLYSKKVRSIEEMTNISKEGRQRLAEACDLGVTAPSACQISTDGTKKYLFPVRCPKSFRQNTSSGELYDYEDSSVEAVMIPEEDRKTLCVSSQAGCRMGCKFCMTGRQGFHGNLSVSDILNQFIADWGFGWSPKRITLSTIGIVPVLKKYLDETRCHLAVSLHDPFGEERGDLMPIQKKYPIEDVIRLIKQYDFTGQRRVSFEYIMFAGLNDDKRHADAFSRLLKGLECRVNLIRFHKIPEAPYQTSPELIMEKFRDRLSNQGITCTIRASRGEDISAACGMLAGKHNQSNQNEPDE